MVVGTIKRFKKNGLPFIKIVIWKHDFQRKILSHSPNSHIGTTCALIQACPSATREKSLPPYFTLYDIIYKIKYSHYRPSGPWGFW